MKLGQKTVLVSMFLAGAMSHLAISEYNKPVYISKNSQGFEDTHNYVVLNGEVTGESVERVTKQLQAMLAQTKGRILLEINSPGGSVLDGEPLSALVASTDRIDVFVSGGLAASMGAQIMMSGSKVFAARQSIILTHGASAGPLTQPLLEELVSILVRVKEARDSGADTPPVLSKAVKDSSLPAKLKLLILNTVNNESVDSILEEVSGTLEFLKIINSNGLVDVKERLKRAGLPEMSLDQIKEKFYNNFTKDKLMTAEQAKEAGLVDVVGSPNMDDYRR